MASEDKPHRNAGPFRLKPWFSERIWGRRSLRPWYAETGTSELVGEAWLTGPESVIETGPLSGRTLAAVAGEIGGGAEFPLLVKLLFPAEKLSVQVHPDDAQAQAMGHARGKTECWYVLEAEPGAAVALGLKLGVTADSFKAAVADGSLEALLEWVPVAVGDMIFVDAGTVHAIGPGMVLLETQQTCDVTYRLYDYGRPRELHLEKGVQVMKARTAAGKVPPVAMAGFTRLIEQQYFTVDRYDLAANGEAVVSSVGPGCLVALAGAGSVARPGAAPVELLAGQALILPEGSGSMSMTTRRGASLVHCFAPVG